MVTEETEVQCYKVFFLLCLPVIVLLWLGQPAITECIPLHDDTLISLWSNLDQNNHFNAIL